MSDKNFDGLIEALNIFKKYNNDDFPTHCEHDVLYVPKVDASKVSNEDLKRLEELDFSRSNDDEGEGFYSFRFGSC